MRSGDVRCLVAPYDRGAEGRLQTAAFSPSSRARLIDRTLLHQFVADINTIILDTPAASAWARHIDEAGDGLGLAKIQNQTVRVVG